MRALVTVNPGWGHFRSLEPIARALELHGHDLAFATSPAFAPFVGETGFHTFPIGPAALRSDLGHAPPPCDPQGLRDLAWSRAKLFVGVRARSALPDLLRLALEWRPDVLVRDSTELAGCLVAETLGLPHASVAVGSFWSAAHLREAAGDELAALRHELGLPRDPNLDMPYRYLHLSFGPRWYVERGATWPPSAVALRTASEAGTRWDTLPDGWARLGRPPIVYGTLGTVANSPEALAMIVGALGALPLHAVVTVGRNVDPKVFAPWPSNVFVERYVPQAQLMPYLSTGGLPWRSGDRHGGVERRRAAGDFAARCRSIRQWRALCRGGGGGDAASVTAVARGHRRGGPGGPERSGVQRPGPGDRAAGAGLPGTRRGGTASRAPRDRAAVADLADVVRPRCVAPAKTASKHGCTTGGTGIG